MEELLILLIVVVIFGALIGGKNFGDTVRKGCGCLLVLLVGVFILFYLFKASDTSTTIENEPNYVSKRICAVYSDPNINSEIIRYAEVGKYFNIKNKNKFNYFYEILIENQSNGYILKEDLKLIKLGNSPNTAKNKKQISNSPSSSKKTSIGINKNTEKLSDSNSNYYRLGSTKDEVLAIQGTPTSFYESGSTESWYYGAANVEFENGVVVSWTDVLGNTLKVRMEAEYIKTREYFTKGSSKDEVLAIHGTPTSLYQSGSTESWYYGATNVEFENGVVVSWSDVLGNTLKVRME